MRLYETHYDSSILDSFAILIGAIIGAYLIIKAVFVATKNKIFSKAYRLFPISVVIFCIAVIAAYTAWLNRIDAGPNYLCFSDGNNLGFDEYSLKKDGRYVFCSASLFGNSYNYGVYIQQDSIISLQPTSARNAPKQRTLIIRPYNKQVIPAFTSRSLVYAINHNGQPRQFDSGYAGFRIVELNLE